MALHLLPFFFKKNSRTYYIFFTFLLRVDFRIDELMKTRPLEPQLEISTVLPSFICLDVVILHTQPQKSR